jgi:hypothetical protein
MTETETTSSTGNEAPQALDPAAEIAPLRRANGRPSKDGKHRLYPDLFNHLPKRMVSQAEAKSQGWVFFYVGEACKYGHTAPRYTSNPAMCVDCIRSQRRLPTIGIQQGGAPRKGPPATRRAPKPALSKQEKQLLEKLADVRNLQGAAEAVGLSLSQALARIASKPALAKAVSDIEKRLGLKGSALAPSGEVVVISATAYEWTDEKRAALIEAWVDTGDIASAREKVGVSPSEFMRECDRNPEFAAAVKAAEPHATRMLEEKAYQLALKGNDKLLTKILSAKNADYRDTVKLDVTSKAAPVDDAALIARLAMLLGKHRGQVIDAIEEREAGALGDARGAGQASLAQPAGEVLPGQGAAATGAVPATFRVLSSGQDS